MVAKLDTGLWRIRLSDMLDEACFAPERKLSVRASGVYDDLADEIEDGSLGAFPVLDEGGCSLRLHLGCRIG